jgi:hypothetical protein
MDRYAGVMVGGVSVHTGGLAEGTAFSPLKADTIALVAREREERQDNWSTDRSPVYVDYILGVTMI